MCVIKISYVLRFQRSLLEGNAFKIIFSEYFYLGQACDMFVAIQRSKMAPLLLGQLPEPPQEGMEAPASFRLLFYFSFFSPTPLHTSGKEGEWIGP